MEKDTKESMYRIEKREMETFIGQVKIIMIEIKKKIFELFEF
jgi:hypothetical protein